MIPLEKHKSESRISSSSYTAWQEIPTDNSKIKDQCISQKLSFLTNYVTAEPKCYSCLRSHRVGVNPPKRCAFGVADEHLFKHLFDDFLFENNSCICSLRTLAVILPRFACHNQTIELSSLSESER